MRGKICEKKQLLKGKNLVKGMRDYLKKKKRDRWLGGGRKQKESQTHNEAGAVIQERPNGGIPYKAKFDCDT